MIRQLCVLLEPQSIYLALARVLSDKGEEEEEGSLEFVAMVVQTLNLILLTASELEGLRSLLRDSFSSSKSAAAREAFVALFKSWCHNPVATFRFVGWLVSLSVRVLVCCGGAGAGRRECFTADRTYVGYSAALSSSSLFPPPNPTTNDNPPTNQTACASWRKPTRSRPRWWTSLRGSKSRSGS